MITKMLSAHSMEGAGQMWRTQRVRGSQFNPLVDFVILAEFDIDTGSTVRHIYPHDIPGYKNDWFADFMLPEGAHNRVVDYTYILLNRDAPQIDQHLWLHPALLQGDNLASPTLTPSPIVSNERTFFPESGGSPNEEKQRGAGKRMLYGINIVKTRHDSSVRRGAIVKAMAIFSKYHFVESLKRPLEYAIDRYFDNPQLEVLEDLFVSLNAVDLRELPRPSYLEQCLMRRGVVFDPEVPRPLDHVPESWTRTVTYYRVSGARGRPSSLKGKEIFLRLPLYRTPDEVGDVCVMLLVKTFGESVMRIYHAILMKQRVLFVGYNHAASEVAQMVLSAVAMVAPPLSNIIRRAYPYSNLSDLSFLETPGYIAGVTNPMFQQHESWWDLLCVLDLPNGAGYIYNPGEDTNRHAISGRASPTANLQVHKSSSKSSLTNIVGSRFQKLLSHLPLTGSGANAHVASDQKFVGEVIVGINALLGEEWVRQQFFDYTSSILNLAQDLRSSAPTGAGSSNNNSRKSFNTESPFSHPPVPMSPKRTLPSASPGIADSAHVASSPEELVVSPVKTSVQSNDTSGGLNQAHHRRFMSDTALNTRDSFSAGAAESTKSESLWPSSVTSSPHFSAAVKNSVLDMKKLSTATVKFIEANRNRVRTLAASSEVQNMPIHPWAWAAMHIRRQSRLSFVVSEKKQEEEQFGSHPLAATARTVTALSAASDDSTCMEDIAQIILSESADDVGDTQPSDFEVDHDFTASCGNSKETGDDTTPDGTNIDGINLLTPAPATVEETADDLFPELHSDPTSPVEYSNAGVDLHTECHGAEEGLDSKDGIEREDEERNDGVTPSHSKADSSSSAVDSYDIPITVMNSNSVEESAAGESDAGKTVSFDDKTERCTEVEQSRSTLRRLFKEARSNSMSSSFFSDSEDDNDDADDGEDAESGDGGHDEDDIDDDDEDHDDVVEGAIANAIVKDTDKDTMGILLRKYLRKLQYEKGLIDSESEAPLYFQVLEQFLQSEYDIQALLVMFPESQGGLVVIARGLFHANPAVYQCAVSILQRVQSFDSTRAAYESLSSYYRSAYQCQQQKVESGVWKFEMRQFRRARRKTRIKMAKDQKTALNAAASMPLLTDNNTYNGYGSTSGVSGVGSSKHEGNAPSVPSSSGAHNAREGRDSFVYESRTSQHGLQHADSNVDLVGAAMGVAAGAAAAGWSVFNSALAAVNPRTSNTPPPNSTTFDNEKAKSDHHIRNHEDSSTIKDESVPTVDAEMEGRAPLGTFIQTTLEMIAAAAEPPPEGEENKIDGLELLR